MREPNYAERNRPLTAKHFTDSLKDEMRRELTALNTTLPSLDWLEISDRKSEAIKLTAIDALPEPLNLRKLKRACVARWGNRPADRNAQGSGASHRRAARADRRRNARSLPEDVLIERLLLIADAYGTNSGLRTAAAGDHARYGGRGILVYWHVERGTMAIHSQLPNCSASEAPR